MLAVERTEFRAEMERLGRVFDRAVTDELLTDYWDVLRDVPFGQFKAASASHIRAGRFFPKPRELRFNPDGQRVSADTRSPDVAVDDWTATLNRMARDVLMARRGVSEETLTRFVAEKNRLARSMRDAMPTPEEWAEIGPGIVTRLREVAAR